MSYHGYNRPGTYRPTKENYPLMDALAVSVAVDRAQGFVKSGQGYYDEATDRRVDDNRQTALRTLRVMTGKEEEAPDNEKDIKSVAVYRPTEADYEKAQEIYDHFDQILLMEKLGDELVKVRHDGQINSFNQEMLAIFTAGAVDVNKELAMIVSLPNSRRKSDVRAMMNEFYRTHAENGYIGEIRQRMKLEVEVKDVKPIPSHNIHLATFVTNDGKVGKFFLNDKMSDIARTLAGKSITLTGTVKKQEVNSYTKCQETVLNRVKIENA